MAGLARVAIWWCRPLRRRRSHWPRPARAVPELLLGFDTATQITAHSHWLRHQPPPCSGRVWIATDPDHKARAVIFARIALGSQGICVGPADWPDPPPAPVNAASCFGMPCARDRCPQTGGLWCVGLQVVRGLVA